MSNLRAELRRRQKEDSKELRRVDQMVLDARRMGVEFNELQLWKTRQTELLKRDIGNKVAAKMAKEYEALQNEYNEALMKQKAEYNRLLDLRTDALADGFIETFNEKLYEAEDYVCLVNVIIAVVAIHMTWGYNKAIAKFVKNLNAAQMYIEKHGVRKVFDQVNEEYGLDLEFDTFDIIDFIKMCEREDVHGVIRIFEK